MFAGNPTGDGQTKSGALRPAACRLSAKKSLKNPPQLHGFDADASIGHREHGRPIDHRHPDMHVSPRIGELDGIVEDDHHQLTDERRVAFDRRLLELVDSDLDVLLPGHDACRAGGVDGDVVEEDPFLLDLPLACIGSREYEQALDDSSQSSRLDLDSAQRRDIVAGVAGLLQRDLGARAQYRDGCSQLMRRVGHEAPHENDGALDWLRGFPDEEESSRRDQDQCQNRNRNKRRDEISVLVLQLLLIGNRDGHELLPRSELESHRVQAECFVLGCAVLHGYLAEFARLPSRLDYPGVHFAWLDWMALNVQQKQDAVGDIELVYRVDDTPAHRFLFELPYPCRPDQLEGCVAQGTIELLLELIGDDGEQTAAQQDDYQSERRYIPDCESQPQPDETLDSQPRRSRLNRQSDIRRRAPSGSTWSEIRRRSCGAGGAPAPRARW